MKFRYLHSASRKHDLSVFMAEIGSNSPRIIEAPSCPLTTGAQGNGHGGGCFAEVAFEFGVKRSGR